MLVVAMSADGTVAVIGGGIVGRCCALMLQKQGIATCILEREEALTASSWNNAGHIAVEQVTPLASLAAMATAPKRLFMVGGALDFALTAPGVMSWVWRYLQASMPGCFRHGKQALKTLVNGAETAWQQLLQQLDAADLYRDQGHWVLWESDSSVRKGMANWQHTDTGSVSFAKLPKALLATLPALKVPLCGGISFSGSGQIHDMPALASLLKAQFLAAGGEWLNADVASLQLQSGRAEVVLANGEHCQFDQVLVCAGAASGKLLATIHPHVPLIAERGYHLEVKCDDSTWPEHLPPLVFEDRSMIVTRFANTLRACSFVEFNALDAKADPRKWQQLRRHCDELGLPFSGNVSEWMGARPTLPDYLPAIGKSDRANNLYYAFGHQHLGLTLAAKTAMLVAEMVQNQRTPSALQAFSLARFQR
jgi:D-amino-acid dehydrogenase